MSLEDGDDKVDSIEAYGLFAIAPWRLVPAAAISAINLGIGAAAAR